jgi:hypothetical protein
MFGQPEVPFRGIGDVVIYEMRQGTGRDLFCCSLIDDQDVDLLFRKGLKGRKPCIFGAILQGDRPESGSGQVLGRFFGLEPGPGADDDRSGFRGFQNVSEQLRLEV